MFDCLHKELLDFVLQKPHLGAVSVEDYALSRRRFLFSFLCFNYINFAAAVVLRSEETVDETQMTHSFRYNV